MTEPAYGFDAILTFGNGEQCHFVAEGEPTAETIEDFVTSANDVFADEGGVEAWLITPLSHTEWDAARRDQIKRIVKGSDDV